MSHDHTLYADLAAQQNFVTPMAQSAFTDSLQLFKESALAGYTPAFSAKPNPVLAAHPFIQRNRFSAGGAAVRQDRTSVAVVDAVSQNQDYDLDPVLAIASEKKAWSKVNSGGNLKGWAANYAITSGKFIASYLLQAYCAAAAGASQLNAAHFNNRSGSALTYQDVLDAKTGIGDGSQRFRTLIVSSAQYAALEKYIVLGPDDAPAIAPLLNPTAQEMNRTGAVERLAGMRVIVYDGVYQDAQTVPNHYALLLATDMEGNPGSGVEYLGDPIDDGMGFTVPGGGILNPGLSFVPNGDYNSLVIKAQAETFGSVWFNGARFAVGTVNPTIANLADSSKWTAGYSNHKELGLVCIASNGDAF